MNVVFFTEKPKDEKILNNFMGIYVKQQLYKEKKVNS